VDEQDPTLREVAAAIAAADFRAATDRDDSDRHLRMATAALAATWGRPPGWLAHLVRSTADLTRLSASVDRARDSANLTTMLAALAAVPSALRTSPARRARSRPAPVAPRDLPSKEHAELVLPAGERRALAVRR
jgi:hypothetical protein